jgi:hypothetical protein
MTIVGVVWYERRNTLLGVCLYVPSVSLCLFSRFFVQVLKSEAPPVPFTALHPNVIPVFRGGERACVEGGAVPRKDRNPSSEAVGKAIGIRSSVPHLDSGLFRVISVMLFDAVPWSRKNRNDGCLGCLA